MYKIVKAPNVVLEKYLKKLKKDQYKSLIQHMTFSNGVKMYIKFDEEGDIYYKKVTNCDNNKVFEYFCRKENLENNQKRIIEILDGIKHITLIDSDSNTMSKTILQLDGTVISKDTEVYDENGRVISHMSITKNDSIIRNSVYDSKNRVIMAHDSSYDKNSNNYVNTPISYIYNDDSIIPDIIITNESVFTLNNKPDISNSKIFDHLKDVIDITVTSVVSPDVKINDKLELFNLINPNNMLNTQYNYFIINDKDEYIFTCESIYDFYCNKKGSTDFKDYNIRFDEYDRISYCKSYDNIKCNITYSKNTFKDKTINKRMQKLLDEDKNFYKKQKPKLKVINLDKYKKKK